MANSVTGEAISFLELQDIKVTVQLSPRDASNVYKPPILGSAIVKCVVVKICAQESRYGIIFWMELIDQTHIVYVKLALLMVSPVKELICVQFDIFA